MLKTSMLFGCSSVLSAACGVAISYSKRPQAGLGLSWPGAHAGTIARFDTPCYAIAVLFAAFACLYAVPSLRFDRSISQWHFWLSIAGLFASAGGFALLGAVGTRLVEQKIEPSQAPLAITFAGLILGPTAFLAGQVFFAFGLTRAIGRLRQT
jgi:hypothetical protein